MKIKKIVIISLLTLLLTFVIIFAFLLSQETPEQKRIREMSESTRKSSEELKTFNNNVDKKLEEDLKRIDNEATMFKKLEQLGYEFKFYQTENAYYSYFTNNEYTISLLYDIPTNNMSIEYMDKTGSCYIDKEKNILNTEKSTYSNFLLWLNFVDLTQEEVKEIITLYTLNNIENK